MATQVTLTLVDGFYTSNLIAAPDSGALLIHLNFTDRKSKVFIETSIDIQDGFAVADELTLESSVFEKTYKLVQNQVLRIRCANEPVSALCNGTIG